MINPFIERGSPENNLTWGEEYPSDYSIRPSEILKYLPHLQGNSIAYKNWNGCHITLYIFF